MRVSPPPRIPILEDSHVRRFLATPLRSPIALTPRQMRRLTAPLDTPSSPRRGVRGSCSVRTRTRALHQPHGPEEGELYQSTARVCFLRHPSGAWRPLTAMWQVCVLGGLANQAQHTPPPSRIANNWNRRLGLAGGKTRAGCRQRGSTKKIKTIRGAGKKVTHRAPSIAHRKKEVIDDHTPSGKGQCAVTNNR